MSSRGAKILAMLVKDGVQQKESLGKYKHNVILVSDLRLGLCLHFANGSQSVEIIFK